MSPQQLPTLRLQAALGTDEQAMRSGLVSRLTLRFAYNMVHRVPQYTRFVRAETTTRFKYDLSADPQRFIDLLRSGELRADDEDSAATTQQEDEVLQCIDQREWQRLLDRLEPDPRAFERVQRRWLYRPVDTIRERLPVGDR
jgi:hypothetical protein